MKALSIAGSLFAAGSILVPSSLLAQTTTVRNVERNLRDIQTVDDNKAKASTFYSHKVASAKQRLASDSSKGFAASYNVVHQINSDFDATGFIAQLEYSRSTDGGQTFGSRKVIHKLTSGETWDGNQTQLCVEGNTVWIVVRSDQLTSGNVAPLVYVSVDQGQNFSGPLLASPAMSGAMPTLKHDGSSPSAARMDAVCSNGRLHICFEAIYVGANLPNNEELFYSLVGLDSAGKATLVKSDTRISTHFPTQNAHDVDGPRIAADGNVVAISWVDDIVGLGNSANNTFVSVSKDLGLSFAAPHNCTNITASSGTDNNSRVAVCQNSIYVICQNSRDGSGDDVYLIYSNDQGATWNGDASSPSNPLIRVNTQANIDVDDSDILCQGASVAVVYYDDRNGTGNVLNQAFFRVDRATRGLAFKNDTATEVQASIKDVNLIERSEWRGNLISISGEFGQPSQSESSMVLFSTDGGRNWNEAQISDGTADADEPWHCQTGNGDLVVTWVDSSTGNTNNRNRVAGIKVPVICDETDMNMGIKLIAADAYNGSLALALISSTGTTPPIVFDSLGTQVGIAFDALTTVGLELSPVFLAVIANGEANLPVVPNLTQTLGSDAWAAFVIINPSQSQPFVASSDANKIDGKPGQN